MSKRKHDAKVFHTLPFDACMLIIQRHPTLPNPNCSLKLRERDGTLWEAFHTNEETQYLYDDIRQMGDEEIKYLLESKPHSTIDAFRQQYDPTRVCAFSLQVTNRKEPVVMSTFLNRLVQPAIADGTCVPRFVAMDKTKATGEEDETLTADFFVTYKHRKLHDEDHNLTCHASIRLTFLRVPEFK